MDDPSVHALLQSRGSPPQSTPLPRSGAAEPASSQIPGSTVGALVKPAFKLTGSVPLMPSRPNLITLAKQIECAIDRYLKSIETDVKTRCIIAQDILKLGLERDPQLMDELYLQLVRHLQGSSKQASIKGWELLLLASCTAAPSSSCAGLILSSVATAATTKVQWPTTGSILAKRTWNQLRVTSPARRRQHAPSLDEIAALLDGSAAKTEISFEDGSTLPLEYDSNMTVAGAVKQIATQTGRQELASYALFQAYKIPRMQREGGNAVARPDSALQQDRLIVDVLYDFEAEGAQQKLLLKKLRFDANEEKLSQPELVNLLEAQQAALDESTSELAALRTQMSTESKKLVLLQSQQERATALLTLLQNELLASEDERDLAERSLKELRQMAVRHNKEQTKAKDVIQQLWVEADELREALKQAQRAAEEAMDRADVCDKCGDSKKRRVKKGTSLASFFTTMDSREQDDNDVELVSLLGGNGSADAAIKAALKEKLSEYLTPSSQSSSSVVPNSQNLGLTMQQLSKLHPAHDQPAQDYRAVARKAVDQVKQLEQQLEFANAAQKALADLYNIELDQSRSKTEQLEALRDEVVSLTTELSAMEAKHKAAIGSRAPKGTPIAQAELKASLEAAMSKLTLTNGSSTDRSTADASLTSTQLAQKCKEVAWLQEELHVLRSSIQPLKMQEPESSPFKPGTSAHLEGAEHAEQQPGHRDIQAMGSISQEALYELLKEQCALEEEHIKELAAMTAEIEQLKARLATSAVDQPEGPFAAATNAPQEKDISSRSNSRSSSSNSGGSACSSPFSELAANNSGGGDRTTEDTSFFSDLASSHSQEKLLSDSKQQLELATAAAFETERALEASKAALDKQVARHHHEKQELERKLAAAAEAKQAELRRREEDLQAQVTARMAEVTHLQAVIKELETTAAAKAQDVKELQKSDIQKVMQLGKKDRALERAAAEIAKLKAEIEELQASAHVTASSVPTMQIEHQQELKMVQDELASVKKRHATLVQEKDAKVQALRQDLQRSREGAEERVREAAQLSEANAREQEAALVAAKQNVSSLEQDVERLRDDLAAREGELSQLAKTVLQIISERDGAIDKLKKLERAAKIDATPHPSGAGVLSSAEDTSSDSWLVDPHNLDWLSKGTPKQSGQLRARSVSPAQSQTQGPAFAPSGDGTGLLCSKSILHSPSLATITALPGLEARTSSCKAAQQDLPESEKSTHPSSQPDPTEKEQPNGSPDLQPEPKKEQLKDSMVSEMKTSDLLVSKIHKAHSNTGSTDSAGGSRDKLLTTSSSSSGSRDKGGAKGKPPQPKLPRGRSITARSNPSTDRLYEPLELEFEAPDKALETGSQQVSSLRQLATAVPMLKPPRSAPVSGKSSQGALVAKQTDVEPEAGNQPFLQSTQFAPHRQSTEQPSPSSPKFQFGATLRSVLNKRFDWRSGGASSPRQEQPRRTFIPRRSTQIPMPAYPSDQSSKLAPPATQVVPTGPQPSFFSRRETQLPKPPPLRKEPAPGAKQRLPAMQITFKRSPPQATAESQPAGPAPSLARIPASASKAASKAASRVQAQAPQSLTSPVMRERTQAILPPNSSQAFGHLAAHRSRSLELSGIPGTKIKLPGREGVAAAGQQAGAQKPAQPSRAERQKKAALASVLASQRNPSLLPPPAAPKQSAASNSPTEQPKALQASQDSTSAPARQASEGSSRGESLAVALHSMPLAQSSLLGSADPQCNTTVEDHPPPAGCFPARLESPSANLPTSAASRLPAPPSLKQNRAKAAGVTSPANTHGPAVISSALPAETPVTPSSAIRTSGRPAELEKPVAEAAREGRQRAVATTAHAPSSRWYDMPASLQRPISTPCPAAAQQPRPAELAPQLRPQGAAAAQAALSTPPVLTLQNPAEVLAAEPQPATQLRPLAAAVFPPLLLNSSKGIGRHRMRIPDPWGIMGTLPSVLAQNNPLFIMEQEEALRSSNVPPAVTGVAEAARMLNMIPPLQSGFSSSGSGRRSTNAGQHRSAGTEQPATSATTTVPMASKEVRMASSKGAGGAAEAQATHTAGQTSCSLGSSSQQQLETRSRGLQSQPIKEFTATDVVHTPPQEQAANEADGLIRNESSNIGDQGSVFTDDSMDEQFPIGQDEFGELIKAALSETKAAAAPPTAMQPGSQPLVRRRSTSSLQPLIRRSSTDVSPAPRAHRRTRSSSSIETASVTSALGNAPLPLLDSVYLSGALSMSALGNSSEKTNSRNSTDQSSNWGSSAEQESL